MAYESSTNARGPGARRFHANAAILSTAYAQPLPKKSTYVIIRPTATGNLPRFSGIVGVNVVRAEVPPNVSRIAPFGYAVIAIFVASIIGIITAIVGSLTSMGSFFGALFPASTAAMLVASYMASSTRITKRDRSKS